MLRAYVYIRVVTTIRSILRSPMAAVYMAAWTPLILLAIKNNLCIYKQCIHIQQNTKSYYRLLLLQHALEPNPISNPHVVNSCCTVHVTPKAPKARKDLRPGAVTDTIKRMSGITKIQWKFRVITQKFLSSFRKLCVVKY